MDGHDVKQMDVNCLRNNIGTVSQVDFNFFYSSYHICHVVNFLGAGSVFVLDQREHSLWCWRSMVDDSNGESRGSCEAGECLRFYHAITSRIRYGGWRKRRSPVW